ncbi:MAG TPA: DoxX family protein [Candidatus Acidoferrales bacterium]|nr:DoxX family protein [Candidatus Acidoferrales bacterium]
MSTMAHAAPVSSKALWTGRIISAVLVLFLLFDSVTKLMKAAFVTQAFAQLGYPLRLAPVIGGILLVCIVFYVIPRTSILGAILLTGYLGGATELNLRSGNPWFETIIPVIVGVLIWGALYLRNPHLRALIPLQEK